MKGLTMLAAIALLAAAPVDTGPPAPDASPPKFDAPAIQTPVEYPAVTAQAVPSMDKALSLATTAAPIQHDALSSPASTAPPNLGTAGSPLAIASTAHRTSIDSVTVTPHERWCASATTFTLAYRMKATDGPVLGFHRQV